MDTEGKDVIKVSVLFFARKNEHIIISQKTPKIKIQWFSIVVFFFSSKNAVTTRLVQIVQTRIQTAAMVGNAITRTVAVFTAVTTVHMMAMRSVLVTDTVITARKTVASNVVYPRDVTG